MPLLQGKIFFNKHRIGTFSRPLKRLQYFQIICTRNYPDIALDKNLTAQQCQIIRYLNDLLG